MSTWAALAGQCKNISNTHHFDSARSLLTLNHLPLPLPLSLYQQVHFYTLQGARLPKELSFGPEVEAAGVAAARVWGDGVVVVAAGSGALWAAVGLDAPRATRLASVPPLAAAAAASNGSGGGAASEGAAGSISAAQIGVIRPDESLSRCLEVVVAAGGRIWVADERSASDFPLPAGAGGAAALAVSPGGAFVAAFCGDGRLRVFASGARLLWRGETAALLWNSLTSPLLSYSTHCTHC